ncbi:MAG: T9SS type A sorting domain-containing protein [Ignavibacteria bacterium]|mgnify:CR=1 FL=1|nr:T9SS type A sorting domain-containing protein [Ignavibacteria bacterium]
MYKIKNFEPLLYISALVLGLLFVQGLLAQSGGNAVDLYNENYLLHGDFIDMGSPNYGLTNKITVCAWVKWNVNPQTYINNHNETEGRYADIIAMDRHTVKDNGQFWFQHSSSNTSFQWTVQTTSSRRSVTSSTTPVINTWYYVAGVYDDTDPSKSLKIYVNGVLENSDNNLSGNINTYNALFRLNIGRLPSGYRLFAGELDEIRLYKRALTQQEIKEQMLSGPTVNSTDMLSYWDMNNSTGVTVTDNGSAGINGTFYSSLVDVHDTSSVPQYVIYDNDKLWVNNTWAGKRIVTIAGDGTGELNTVLSNDSIRVVLSNPWVTKPRLDDLGSGTGMTWYGIIDSAETTQWKKSTAPLGRESIYLITQDTVPLGDNGGFIVTNITSTPSSTNNLVAYYSGTAAGPPISTGETFPAGIDRRSNIVWGVYEWGSVTATVALQFDGVAGILNVPNLKLLRRSRNSTSWSEVTTAILDTDIMTFTITGVTTFYEYSIGGNAGNPLPVTIGSLGLSVNDNNVLISWKTVSELNNSGFEIDRYGTGSNGAGEWSKIGFVKGAGSVNEEREYSFTDKGLNKGTYTYRLKQIDFNGNYEYFNITNAANIGSPGKNEISQNYPNPSNPVSVIEYRVAARSLVRLVVYDLTGKEVATLVNGELDGGYYSARFDGTNISSGIYFYRFTAVNADQNFTETKRLILIK